MREERGDGKERGRKSGALKGNEYMQSLQEH